MPPRDRALSIGTLVLVLAALGIRFAFLPLVNLAPEEAYYWMYSENPSLSYYDHPPMVAWEIGLGTRLFGDTEWGVRVIGSLAMLASGALMFLWARIWFGARAALLAAALVLTLPVFYGAGCLATMDSALIFWWLVGLLGVSLALRRGRSWGWYLGALGLGGALLSKYTGAVLGLGILLALAMHRPWRRHFLTVHPYAAALLALALFSPVLVWNVQNGWASFGFQTAGRLGEDSSEAIAPLRFLLLQVGVATPVLLLAVAALAARSWRRRRRPWTARSCLVWCLSLPLLLLLTVGSLKSGAHVNWPMPAYLVLIPAASRWALAQQRRARIAGGRAGWALGMQATVGVCAALCVAMVGLLLAGQPRGLGIAVLEPWPRMAAAVEDVEDRLEAETQREPLIVADGKYRLASVLAFYRTPIEHDSRASRFTTSQTMFGKRSLAYAYWIRPEEWVGRDMVIVGYRSDPLSDYAKWFDRLEFQDEPRLEEGGYVVAIGRNYRRP